MDNPADTPPDMESHPAPPPPPLYPKPNEAFLVLVITLAATLLSGALLVNVDKAGIFLSEILFLLPPLLYLHFKGYSIRRCLRWNRVSLPVLFFSLLIGLALIILLDEMDRLVNMFYPMPENLQKLLMDFLELKTWSDYLIVGLGIVVVAAVCEESLFRGLIQVSFEAHGTVTRAVLFGALLFAVAHFNPWWMIQILILGVFLGFLSWRSDSSIPGMLVHGLNNGLALFLGDASQKGGQFTWYSLGDHVAPAILMAAAALLFLGLKFFIRLTEEPLRETLAPHETPTT